MLKPVRNSRHNFLVSLSVAIALAGGMVSSVASPMAAVWLTIHRDGTPLDWLAGNNVLLDDRFNNGNPLLGPNFPDGVTASTYSLWGPQSPADALLAAREPGGALVLDPSYGGLTSSASGSAARVVLLRLLTSTVADSNDGLPKSRSFAASLLIPLVGMPPVGQSLFLRLTDIGFGNRNDVIELSVVGTPDGKFIRFQKQDFLAGTTTLLGWTPVAPPTDAVAIALSLAHPTLNDDGIYGSYGYASGTALIGGFTIFPNSTTVFQGETHTRVEILAAQNVPEPESYAMMLAGVGVVGFATRRRRSTNA